VTLKFNDFHDVKVVLKIRDIVGVVLNMGIWAIKALEYRALTQKGTV
jgi:hypothetical protein